MLIFSFNVNALIPLLSLENIAAIRSHTNVLQRATLNNFNVFTSEKSRQKVISFFYNLEQHHSISDRTAPLAFLPIYSKVPNFSPLLFNTCSVLELLLLFVVWLFVSFFVCLFVVMVIAVSKKKSTTVPSTFVFWIVSDIKYILTIVFHSWTF